MKQFILYREIEFLLWQKRIVQIENYNLLNGMKRYLRIKHQDDDKDLLDYLRKQASYI
jgi:hypothetical protein